MNARYLCESGEIDPPAKTRAIAAQTFSVMKIWFSEFLQNAARDLTKENRAGLRDFFRPIRATRDGVAGRALRFK